MIYHVFSYRIQGDWYKDSVACSDELFEKIMERLGGKLPINVSVFHYGSPGPAYYPLTNTVILSRPTLSLNFWELLNHTADPTVALYDKSKKKRYTVQYNWGRFAICSEKDGWLRFYYADGIKCRISLPMQIVPLSFLRAKVYVDRYHRHNTAPQGHKFSVGLTADGVDDYIGVAIASIPKARALNDGLTLEINRVCSDPAYANASSKLYGAAIAAGKAMGYRRFITYTLPEESGSSVRAVGFQYDGIVRERPNGWNRSGRPRQKPIRYPTGQKKRWVLMSE